MARKKQEVALQLEVNSQEEWEELMQKEGLIIVDVFQDWCGPCKAVLSFFRRIKNEIGDDFLHFATAKCDTIDSLDKYRGRCEPCFLIYGGGSLVSVIRGANPPALEEIIKTKLQEEHKVMKGEIERKEIKDPYLAGIDVEEKVETTDKEVEEIEQEVTLALIKPDLVKAGKVEEIISKLSERGIEILAQQERNLTEEEAKSFYHHMESTEYFESLITFITSGPSYVLVLAKGDEGIIHEFRELIGPKVIEEAKESAPESFRAIYGTNSIENAIHGADDKDSAHRELAFFFPDFVVPKIARKKQEVSIQQRTLALIRPAAFIEFKANILEKINAAGFQISMQKEVKLTKEDAEIFYKDHIGRPYFDELTTEMSKGTLLALALEKQNAISGFRGILGPKDVEKAKENDPSSLRAQFFKEDIGINLIHGSDSEENAQHELKYFFPVEQTIAAIKPDGLENRDEIINKITEARFKIVKTMDMVMTKELAEEFYQDQKDQEYFDDLITHMQSGSTLFMVLSREDAVRGWRSIMGPKDPDIASESYPDSIRSIYGKDIKENAVYGSADNEEVSRVMMLIFGTLEFFEDGSLLPQYVTQEEEQEDVTKTDDVTHEHGDSKESEAVEQDNEKDVTDHSTTVEEGQETKTEVQEMSNEDQETKTEGQEDISEAPKDSGEPELAEQSKPEEDQGDVAKESEDAVATESEDVRASESEEVVIQESTVEESHTEDTETKDLALDNEEKPTEETKEETVNTLEISEEKTEIVEAQPTEEDKSPTQSDNVVEEESHSESLGGPIAQGTNENEDTVVSDKGEETVVEESSIMVNDKTDENTHEEIRTNDNEETVTQVDETVVSKEREEEDVAATSMSVGKENEGLEKNEETAVTTEQEETTVVEETAVSKETEEITHDKEHGEETIAESSAIEAKTEDVSAVNEPTEDDVVVETTQHDDTDNAVTENEIESDHEEAGHGQIDDEAELQDNTVGHSHEENSSANDDMAAPLGNDAIESDNLLSDTSLNDEIVPVNEGWRHL